MSEELIPQTAVNIWTTTSELTARRKCKQATNTWVTQLQHNGKTVMTAEGLNAKDELSKLANLYNQRNTSLKQHHKAFADIPGEAGRATAAIKHQTAFLGPSFQDTEATQA